MANAINRLMFSTSEEWALKSLGILHTVVVGAGIVGVALRLTGA